MRKIQTPENSSSKSLSSPFEVYPLISHCQRFFACINAKHFSDPSVDLRKGNPSQDHDPTLSLDFWPPQKIDMMQGFDVPERWDRTLSEVEKAFGNGNYSR
jgi:hypothetical protein